MKNYVAGFIENCVRTEALKFGDFTLKSGRSSRYFFNLGDAMSDGRGVVSVRDAYIEHLVTEMGFHDRYDPEKLFLFGPAYKGIALAGEVAGRLCELSGANVRWGFDRKEVKDHGPDTGWMVGNLRDGDTIIIVDDVLTTASTKRQSWKNLQATRDALTHGGVMIALDRQETDLEGNAPIQLLESEGIPVSTILGARELFEYLHNREIEGRVLVDDEAYDAFQEHQKEFGVRD